MWSILGVFGAKKDEKESTAIAPPIVTEQHTITPSAEPQPVVQKESTTTAPIAEPKHNAIASNSPLVDHKKLTDHVCGPQCYKQASAAIIPIVVPTHVTNAELAQAVYIGFEGSPEEKANLLIQVRDIEKLKTEYRSAISVYNAATERYRTQQAQELERAKQIRDLESQLRDVKQRAGRNSSLEHQVQQLQDANKTLRRKADALKNEQDTLKVRQKEQSAEYHQLEQRLKTMQDETAKSQKSLAEARDELTKAQARMDDLAKKAEDAWKTAEEIDEDFKKVQNAIDPLRTELKSANEQVAKLDDANKDLQERLKRRDVYSKGLEAQLDDARKTNQQLLGATGDSQKAIDAEIQARELLKAEKQALEQVIKDARAAIEKYESHESPSETIVRLIGDDWTGAGVRSAVSKANKKAEAVITESYARLFPSGLTEEQVIGLYSEQEYVLDDAIKRKMARLDLPSMEVTELLDKLAKEESAQDKMLEVYRYAHERAVSKRDLESLDTLFAKSDEPEASSKEDAFIEEIEQMVEDAKDRKEDVKLLRESVQKRRLEYQTGIPSRERIEAEVPSAVYYTSSPTMHQVKVVFPWAESLNSSPAFKELAAIVARSLHERGVSRGLKIESDAIEFTSSYPSEKYEERHVANSAKKIAEQIVQLAGESPLGRLGIKIDVTYLGRGMK